MAIHTDDKNIVEEHPVRNFTAYKLADGTWHLGNVVYSMPTGVVLTGAGNCVAPLSIDVDKEAVADSVADALEWLAMATGAADAIRGETRPFNGHPDPGAIQDCWATVNDALRKAEGALKAAVAAGQVGVDQEPVELGQAIHDGDGPQQCTHPDGHDFVCTGTAYGGDDESYHGEGRSYCQHCGADGDA